MKSELGPDNGADKSALLPRPSHSLPLLLPSFCVTLHSFPRGKKKKKEVRSQSHSFFFSPFPFIPTPFRCHLSAERSSLPERFNGRSRRDSRFAKRKNESAGMAEWENASTLQSKETFFELEFDFFLKYFVCRKVWTVIIFYLSLVFWTKVVRLLLRKGLKGPRQIGRLLLLMLLQLVVVGRRGVVGRADLLQAAVVGMRRGGPLRGRHPRHDAHVLHPRHSGRRRSSGGGSRGGRRGHRGRRLRRSNAVRRGRCGRLCDNGTSPLEGPLTTLKKGSRGHATTKLMFVKFLRVEGASLVEGLSSRTVNCLLLLLLVVVMKQRRVGRAHHVAVHGGVVQERHLGRRRRPLSLDARSGMSGRGIVRFFLTFELRNTLVSKAGSSALNPRRTNNCFLSSSSKSLDNDT